MNKSEETATDEEKVETAYCLIKEQAFFNPNIEQHIWASACQKIVVSLLHKSGMSYGEFVHSMNEIAKCYECYWDKDMNGERK